MPANGKVHLKACIQGSPIRSRLSAANYFTKHAVSHALGLLYSKTFPLPKVRVFVSFRDSFLLMPLKFVLPAPRTTGLNSTIAHE
jgi:hypothetical protein